MIAFSERWNFMEKLLFPACSLGEEFEALPFTRLTYSLWENGDPYRPPTFFKMALVQNALTVELRCFEDEPKALFKKRDEPIWCDSCLEFFLEPLQDRKEYINIECNALGTFLCEFGEGREGRKFVKELTALSPSVSPYKKRTTDGNCWGVKITVTKDFIASLYGVKPDEVDFKHLRANFYKCGDECERPHYLAFRPVGTNPPGFHAPDYFTNFELKI